MTASTKTKVGMLAGGMSCLLVVYALAQPLGQPGTPGQPGQPTPPRPPGQFIQPDRPTNQPTRPGESAQLTARTQNPEVELYIASCLLAKNQAEIEIAQFAQERSQNPQVKQFAQQLVADHRAAVQKLHPLAGATRTAQPGQLGQPIRNQPPGFDSQVNAPQSGTPTAPGNPTQPGYGTQPGQPAGGTVQAGGAVQPGATIQAGGSTQPAGTSTQPQRIGNITGAQGSAVNELIALEKQIVQHCTENLKEKLQQKQGAEFDHCFVGSQIAAHMQMASALEVIQSQSSGQLRQIAGDAKQTVDHHLKTAEQLAEQLMASTGRQADRTPTETRVDR